MNRRPSLKCVPVWILAADQAAGQPLSSVNGHPHCAIPTYIINELYTPMSQAIDEVRRRPNF